MFDVRVKVFHAGCWMQMFHEKFSSRMVSHIVFSLDGAVTSDVVHIFSESDEEFDGILSYLKAHKTVKHVDVLSRQDRDLYVQVHTDVSKISSIFGTIAHHGGFVNQPVKVEDGWEFWNFVIPSKDKLDRLLRSLEKGNKTKLLHVKDAFMDFSYLSPKQRETLAFALKKGYYEWPRKISAGEIAERRGVSKSTVLQHLRSAERKIMARTYLS